MAKKLLNIPLEFGGSASTRFNINLDGTMASFNIYFNPRDKYFYFDIKTNYGQRNGLKCIPETPLANDGIFPDETARICVLRSSNLSDPIKPSFEDFGKGWGLYYVYEDADDDDQ